MKVLIIDNYDSFTFNLYQLIGELVQFYAADSAVDVVRNNVQSVETIRSREYDRIVISPGPGDPREPAYFGVCAQVIRELGAQTPLLGVCLGLQGIASVFGGNIIRARTPMHGKTSVIHHDGRGVFQNIPQAIEVMRYHSLVVDSHLLPKTLEVSATANGEIMGLRHTEFPIEGVQFHPESFATEAGKTIMKNFLFHTRDLL